MLLSEKLCLILQKVSGECNAMLKLRFQISGNQQKKSSSKLVWGLKTTQGVVISTRRIVLYTLG